MKRRILSLLLVACMAIGLCACGSDKKGEQETTGKAEGNGEDTVIGINPEWAETTVFYEIFVRSFADGNGDGIGDFKGIEENLDYLKDLGIGAIWLMPMMESTTYHGYDVVDYYAPNPDYGTMEEFDSLVNACHEKGIKVIIDFVVNHTSSSNAWFKEALADESSKYREFYSIADKIPVDEKDSTYSSWRQDEETGMYYYAHYDKIMPDLNYNKQAVRDEIKNVAKFWLEHGVDGFRLDGSKEIDADIKVTLSWWTEFTNFVADINKEAFIVGENWTTEYAEVGRYYEAMPSSFNFIAADAILSMSKGQYIDIVEQMNKMRERYTSKVESTDVNAIMIDSVMIGNHDMDRVVTRVNSVEKLSLQQLYSLH